ncbi:MAG: tRNA lysidine(34) synthetase TilS [bacterium]
MFRRTRKVLLALSGGTDSLATLIVLQALGAELGFEVEACHFDHQLRPESKSDMDRVRELCSGLGVECVTGEGDVAGVAAQMKRGIEEMAREMRYQFLSFVAEKEGADCIATGHTADDQAETILMRVVRGSGIRGIRGMLPVSGVPGSEAQRLVRPLLQTSRANTVAICAEAGVVPVADASNDDLRFSRNRIRHDTLGKLAAINPSVAHALIGLGKSAREAFTPIEHKSFEVQPRERGPVGAIFAIGPMRGLPSEALSLMIEREAMFYHLRPQPNRTRLENLQRVLTRGAGAVTFGDTAIEASCGYVRMGPVLEAVPPFEPTVVNVPADTRAGPWIVSVRTDELSATPEAPVVALDSLSTAGLLKLRPAVPGDRITLRGVSRKLSDLLINEKVPSWERAGIVVLADSTAVVAVFGATRTFVRDGDTPDLWVKLAASPQR